MIIRPIEDEDASELLAFYQSLSEEVARVFLPPGPVSPDTVEQHLEAVRTGTSISFVLDNDGMIMGHAFLSGLDRRVPMVSIGLRDAIVGCGYGRQMMERLLAVADARRIPVTALTVVKSNHRAEALYRSLGYRRKHESSFRVRNDSWYMERRLPPRDRDADSWR